MGLLVGLFVGLSGPAAIAHANTSTSLNWSGYAVHRSGVSFRRVSGEWRVPAGACAPGSQGYSAFWVGIGGYRLTSQALEQVGTELDCTPTGRTVLSAWYELVPAPVRRLSIALSPGDLVRARVRVRGHRVTVSFADLTTHRSFHRVLHARHVDVGSAEWIAEAPSECLGISSCQVLPLANFGTVDFTHVTAETTGHRWGGIASRHWNASRILLANTNGRRYVSGASASSVARPSGLKGRGRRFTITYAGTPTPSTGTGASVASLSVRPAVRPQARLGG